MNDKGSEPLPLSEVAVLAGCAPARLRYYIELGLFDEAKLTRADVSAVRLVDSFEAGGLSAELLARLVREGTLSLDFARNMFASQVMMTNMTYREVFAELGLDEEFARAVISSIGLAGLDVDQHAREDDAAFLALTARAEQAGLSRSALLRYLRTFGQAMHRIAAAQGDLFRVEVEEPMIEQGIPIGDFLNERARRRRPLQMVAAQAVQLLHGRFVEDVVFENVAVRLHEALREYGLPPPARDQIQIVCFADMAGFTEYVRDQGDIQGAELAGRMEEVVERSLRAAQGRVIKVLGDGTLILFRDPVAALQAAFDIVRLTAEEGLLPVHIGMAAGRVIYRDGDIFGTTVNRAARLAARARPGVILVDEVMRRLCGDKIDGEWRPEDIDQLKGLPDVRAYSWSPMVSPSGPSSATWLTRV
jgi:adenylate cyclase